MKKISTSWNEFPPHVPIMVQEVLQGFAGTSLRIFYEGTVGAAGHAKAILEAHPEIELYLACDKDPEALNLAEKELFLWKEKIKLIQGDFADLETHLEENQIVKVDGFFLI